MSYAHVALKTEREHARISNGLLPRGYCKNLNLEKITSSVLSVLLLIYVRDLKLPIKRNLYFTIVVFSSLKVFNFNISGIFSVTYKSTIHFVNRHCNYK